MNWEFTSAKDRQGMLHPQANNGDYIDETITIIPTQTPRVAWLVLAKLFEKLGDSNAS